MIGGRGKSAGTSLLPGAVLVLWSAVASAQLGNQLAALNQLCRDPIAKGNFEDALRVCRRVSFDIGKLAPGSPEFIASLVNIGDVKRLVENYVDADAFYQEALKVIERSRGKDSAAALDMMERIVEIKIKRGKFLDAETVLTRSIAIRAKGAAANDPDVAIVRLRHADLQSLSHQFPEAERNYAAVIAIFAAGSERTADAYRTAVRHLAETLEREQKFQRAEIEYLRLLDLTMQRPPNAKALTVAQVLDRLGFVVEQQNRRADALSYYQRELTLLKATGGAQDLVANLEAQIAALRPATAADLKRN